MKKTTTEAERRQEQARAELRLLLPPGSTVWTVLRHCSASGMSRLIDVYVIQDNTPRWLSMLVSRAIPCTFDAKKEALRVRGTGMDMGLHVVSELAHRLYPDGYGCIGEGCPSNDHTNGDRDYTPHGLYDEHGAQENRGPCSGEVADACRNHWHKSGGSAFRHRWM